MVLPLERVKKRSFYLFFTHFGGQDIPSYDKIYELRGFWVHGENLENMGKNEVIPSYKEL